MLSKFFPETFEVPEKGPFSNGISREYAFVHVIQLRLYMLLCSVIESEVGGRSGLQEKQRNWFSWGIIFCVRSFCVENNHSLIHCLPEHQAEAAPELAPQSAFHWKGDMVKVKAIASFVAVAFGESSLQQSMPAVFYVIGLKSQS